MKSLTSLLTIEEIANRTNIGKEKVAQFLEILQKSMQVSSRTISVIEKGVYAEYVIERTGLGVIENQFGKFWYYNFRINDTWKKYSVIVRADIDLETFLPKFRSLDQLIMRTDSGCETGQIFRDHTCECGEQLHLAMRVLSEVGEGMIINIPYQDGRGKGLDFKLATLWLQAELGLDTVQAAAYIAAGSEIDVRTYSGVIGILKFFGIPETCQINLATNNPKKAEVFAENGYMVTEYTPVVIPANEHTEAHLRAKQEHLGHKGLIIEKGEDDSK